MAAFRAADIYSNHLSDKEHARLLLNKIIERFPGSEESTLAQSKLNNPDAN